MRKSLFNDAAPVNRKAPSASPPSRCAHRAIILWLVSRIALCANLYWKVARLGSAEEGLPATS
jgi:hypothetical protein